MLIDTNILIYAINADSPKNKIAQKFLKDNLGNLEIAHQNILEAIRVLTHPKFSKPMTLKNATDALLGICESFDIISPDQKSYYLFLELINLHKLTGNRIFDAYLVATAISNNVFQIATDNIKDFKRFNQVKTIDPFSNRLN